MKKELKTLKDLQDGYLSEDGELISKKTLRKEAIKRAKHYTYQANIKSVDDRDILYWTAKRIEVMRFFNLTEEDLKEDIIKRFN